MEQDLTMYHHYLIKVAISNLTSNNRHWAEDIVQETYYKAISKKTFYDTSKSELKTWLSSITKNLCIDFNRKRTNQELKYDNFYTMNEFYNEDKRIDKDMNIRAFLKQLSHKEQCVIRMKFFFDMTAKEIAELTGIKHTTIPVIYQRTLNKLKKRLKDQGIEKEIFG